MRYLITRERVTANWKRWQQFLLRIDFLQLIPALLLVSIGIAFIYGTGQHIGGFVEGLWFKQLQWVCLGAICWITLAFIDYRNLGIWSWFFYGASIVLLILVFFIGVKSKGATRWIDLRLMRVQPSELAKFATVLAGAWVLSLRKFDINRLPHMCLLGALIGLPFLLILKEPDLGSALVLIPLSATLVFVAKLKWKYILIALVIALIAVPSVYPFLKDYQKKRIQVFLNPDDDPRGSGWHQYQAELAVGSGGMYGKGYRNGTQSMLGFLPETHTDFIYSVIAEETGFVGATAAIGLYGLILLSALRTAAYARDEFGRYLAVGIAAILFTHSVVNIGMCIRLMPVTGLPLPLLSYGGSFMLSTMIYLGVLQSIYARRKIGTSKSLFEII